MISQYDCGPVLIQWILIVFEAILEKHLKPWVLNIYIYILKPYFRETIPITICKIVQDITFSSIKLVG